jgi:hypothetical protein
LTKRRVVVILGSKNSLIGSRQKAEGREKATDNGYRKTKTLKPGKI